MLAKLAIALSVAAASFLVTTQPVREESPLYSPSQVRNLISSGAAKSHGAQFENQGLGCMTFLWKESDEHHVFFFTRDGVAVGEYRDETLDKGRFIQIDAMYLAAGARANPPKDSLPFVEKLTTHHWENGVWTGSTVTWSLLMRGSDGAVTVRLKKGTEVFSKAAARVVVSTNLMRAGRQYFLGVYKRVPSEFDKAFYGWVEEGKGLRLWWGEITEGSCEIRGEWPVTDPEFLLDLQERIPNPPLDATPSMIRTKSIASMRWVSAIQQGETIKFVPDEKAGP